MTQFKYNAQFTFKAKELIPAIEKKLAKLKQELEKYEKAKKPTNEKEEQFLALAKDLGIHVGPITKKGMPSSRIQTTQIRTLQHLLKALRTQDEHRMYRLDIEDIAYYGILDEDDDGTE